MQAAIGAVLFLAASLAPTRGWFAPSQPLNIEVKAERDSTLVLTDFNGRVLESKAPTDVKGDATVNLRDLYVATQTPGTYILYLTKKAEGDDQRGASAASIAPDDFLGTPLVIGIREDRRRGAPPGPMVVRVEPMRYALLHTAHGPVTMAFYYDVAPNTVSSVLTLAEQGYYDGLTFHRIVPGFVIQGGDPRGDGTGGPGYQIDAEFSGRPHEAGALSMARNGDPGEAPGVMPRPEFANTAGSQFFVCLNYDNTKQLDGKYTVFGKVTGGMEAVTKIAQAPLTDERTGRPQSPQVIQKVEVKPVTKEANPYAQILKPRDVTQEIQGQQRQAQPAPAPAGQ